MNRLSPKQYLCLFSLFLAGVASLTSRVSAQEAPLRLTLRDAIEKGLQANLVVGGERYADALEAVRTALDHVPDHAGLNYNYACFATLAGDTGDETFAHLRRAVELLPRFREDARRDDDFTAVRDDPRFEEALR